MVTEFSPVDLEPVGSQGRGCYPVSAATENDIKVLHHIVSPREGGIYFTRGIVVVIFVLGFAHSNVSLI